MNEDKISYYFCTVHFFREGQRIRCESINADLLETDTTILDRILYKLKKQYIEFSYDNYMIEKVGIA